MPLLWSLRLAVIRKKLAAMARSMFTRRPVQSGMLWRRSLRLAAIALIVTAFAVPAISALVPSTPNHVAALRHRHAFPPRVNVKVPSHPRHSRAVTVVTVRAGDSLWTIARHYLHSGSRWTLIYRLNRAEIGSDPSLIQPRMRLKI